MTTADLLCYILCREPLVALHHQQEVLLLLVHQEQVLAGHEASVGIQLREHALLLRLLQEAGGRDATEIQRI